MISFLDTKKSHSRTVVVGMLLFCFSASAWALQNRAELVPFSIETYLAVTKKSLQENPGRQCSLTKPGAMQSLLEKSKETAHPFVDGRVRGMLEENGVAIFVDAEGVFEYGSRRYVVTEKDLRDVLKNHFKCSPPL